MAGRGVLGVLAVFAAVALLLPSVAADTAGPAPASRPGPAPAAFVPFRPNVRVNTIRPNATYAYQVEPTMVETPQGRLLVGWKEASTHNGGGERVSVSYSADGGATWAPDVFMPLAVLPRQSDPWLTVRPDGRVFYSRIEYDTEFAPSGISVTSTTDGVAWGPTHYYSDAPNFADKESAAHAANGDLLWVWNSDASSGENLVFARSADDGASWSPKVRVNDVTGTLGGIVATSPNGTIDVVFWSWTTRNVLFDRSFDGGQTWHPDVRVNDVAGSADSPLAADPVVLPSMAVAANGTIYVLWPDYRNARPGGIPNGDMDIYASHSADGGATWSPAVRVNDDATTARQWMPSVVVDPQGTVHAAWMDDRNGGHDVYYANSTDGGTTWGPNVRVSDVSTALAYDRPGDYLALVADRSTVYVAWTDGRGPDLDIYFAKLTGLLEYTVTTSPPGLQVEVDGQAYTAPASFTWNSTTVHTVNAPSPQAVTADTRYAFDSWSDAGAQNHAVVAGVGNTTLIAQYRAEHAVTIATTPVPLQLVIDGATQVAPVSTWWTHGSAHTLAVPSPQVTAPGERYVYDTWADAPLQNRSVIVDGPMTLAAQFHEEFELSVRSAYGNPQGSGWYRAGADAPFSVEPLLAGSGARHTFTAWSGDSNATSPTASIAMTGPKNVTARWFTEYLLTIFSDRGTPVGAGWHAEGTGAAFSVEATVDGPVSGIRYAFAGWRGDSTAATNASTILMDGPKTVLAQWRTEVLLTILSVCGTTNDCGSPEGAGWYAVNGTANVGIGTEVTVNGTTYRFVGWDNTETNATLAVTMRGPLTLRALWEVVPPTTAGLPILEWIVLLVAIVVAFLVIAFFVWRRRRRKETNPPKPTRGPPPDT